MKMLLAISSIGSLFLLTTPSTSAFVTQRMIQNQNNFAIPRTVPLFGQTDATADEATPGATTDTNSTSGRSARVRQRVAELARKRLSGAPWLRSIAPMPRAVAAVLKDATFSALNLAVDEVLAYRNKYSSRSSSPTSNLSEEYDATQIDEAMSMIEDAFSPLEILLTKKRVVDDQLLEMVAETKSQCLSTVAAMEAASMAQAQGAVEAVAAVQLDNDTVRADVAVDFADMAPPFLDEDSCLVPGEPVVRVEKAPENSRRIFAGIDIPVAVDKVWDLLTDYENLQRAVPNLVINNVLELYDGEGNDAEVPEETSVKDRSVKLKGALLRQVGGAKVAGIQFSARTTLEVREWPNGLPAIKDVSEESKLERYKFPRPFALSSLPTKDITMQSIQDDDGEFRMYQGVWRMQPLPGCAPPGEEAMRLTYAVEISPRAYLPVQLIEKRIVRDLCRNLVAVRDYVTPP